MYVCTNQLVTIFFHRCSLAYETIWRAIEVEDALHWLSTLGGAYSNLGEHKREFVRSVKRGEMALKVCFQAEKAGMNAFHQMRVALMSGDPRVLLRCWLFVAMSHLQTDRLNSSRAIILRVYAANYRTNVEAVASGEKAPRPPIDAKVAKMCRGIWARWLHAKRTKAK